jgi:RNA polymerase sigma-70 factor, ECF subfamily
MNSRMETTDAPFVAGAREGDPEAFRVLVERHSRSLFRLAFRMTGNASDAEDIVQESFLRAFRELDKFDERSGFGSWVYRIAANCALDLLRSRRRRAELAPAGDAEDQNRLASLPSAEPAPDRLALDGEVTGRIEAAMHRLSETERAAFVLRHCEGLSIEDVSRALGCQTSAAKHSVFRAVQKLRRELEPALSPVR